MCLAVPAKVISIEGDTATIDFEGNRRLADISLLDDVAMGEYVIVHAGFAIEKYDEHAALETIELLREMRDADGA